MSEDIRFTRISGKAPRVIRRHSLLDDLLAPILEEPEGLSKLAKLDFTEMRDILTYGGESIEIKIEHSRAIVDQDSHDEDLRRIFDVLALDLAAVFPSLPGSGDPKGSFTGRQSCLCMSPEGSDERNNWYYHALEEYFNTEPGGSLLSFPQVRLNYRRWWVLVPNESVSSIIGDSIASLPLNNEFIWKSKFDPSTNTAKDDSSEHLFQKRFDQFGTEVFKELAKVQSAAETYSTVIIWIYVGPADHPAQQSEHNAPSWGVSLFAVIKPAEFVKNSLGHWMDNPQLQASLLKAVNQLYLYLASAAYKTLEYRRLLDEAQMTASQAVAHEFKNLTQDIASLGGDLYSEFYDVTQKIRRQVELEPNLIDNLNKRLSRLGKLSTISRLTNAVALATYWLTTPDVRYSIVFMQDPACRIFDAAVHFLLAMCKETRPFWVITGPALDEVCRTLESVYDTDDQNELVERMDVALLLFVISEPVRNLRSKDTSHPKVFIHTEVRGQSLYICQKTFESVRPKARESSTAAKRVNHLLSAGTNLAGGNIADKFVTIDETVRTVSSKKHPEGYFEVHRETKIDVFGIPIEE